MLEGCGCFLDENVLNFEFDSAKFDNVIFLELVLLLHIPIGHAPDDEVHFLVHLTARKEPITGIWLVHLVDVPRHVEPPLSIIHLR